MALNYCSIASGSSGNCHFISTDSTKLLLDVGMSYRYIKKSLEAIGESVEEIDGIFITHEHSDHIKGLPMILKKQKIPVYITERTLNQIKDKIREEDYNKVVLVDANIEMNIGDILIQSFEISHDAVEPKGYSFLHQDKKLSIVTDIGIMTEEVVEHIKNSNFLVIECNHDVNMLMVGPYPYYLKRRIMSEIGHLSNDDAAITIHKVFQSGKLKNVVLAHLSKENNMPEIAHLTVKKYLEERGVDTESQVNLDLTYRDKIGKFYRIV